MKRILYIDREGNDMDIVATIVKRKSKAIVIRIEDHPFDIVIPNGAVTSISEPVKESDEK